MTFEKRWKSGRGILSPEAIKGSSTGRFSPSGQIIPAACQAWSAYYRFVGCAVWWAVLIMACGTMANSVGQLIPPDRLYTEGWRTAGVQGGVPDTSGRPIHATITSTGDTTDRTATINNAIATCPSGQVVVLGPGTFRVNGTLNINNKSGVVVRGTLVNGVKATIIDSRQSGAFGWVMGNTSADYQKFDGPELTVDAAQGATVLTFASAASFTAGN